MLKLISCENALIANHYLNVFKSNGIKCLLKNENLQAVAGGIETHQWPEIWLMDESQQLKAKALINELETHDSAGSDWQCQQCDNTNEPQFNACWSCARPKVLS